MDAGCFFLGWLVAFSVFALFARFQDHFQIGVDILGAPEDAGFLSLDELGSDFFEVQGTRFEGFWLSSAVFFLAVSGLAVDFVVKPALPLALFSIFKRGQILELIFI